MSFLSNKDRANQPIDASKITPKEAALIVQVKTAEKRLNSSLKKAEGDETFASPLEVGIAKGHPGFLTDEEWAAGAVLMTKRIGFTRWALRMLSILRHELKGKPFKPLPQASDSCPCKSKRKYSECCGIGIEETDPEECKRGNHNYQSWSMTDKGRLVRGCWACTMIEEAPWAADTELDGIRVVLIGCRYCGAIPTTEDAKKEIDDCKKFDLCGFCGKVIGFKEVHIQHKYVDGLHVPEWTITQAAWNPLYDFTSEALGTIAGSKSVCIHETCLKSAFPFWEALTNDKFSRERDAQLESMFNRQKKEEGP